MIWQFLQRFKTLLDFAAPSLSSSSSVAFSSSSSSSLSLSSSVSPGASCSARLCGDHSSDYFGWGSEDFPLTVASAKAQSLEEWRQEMKVVREAKISRDNTTNRSYANQAESKTRVEALTGLLSIPVSDTPPVPQRPTAQQRLAAVSLQSNRNSSVNNNLAILCVLAQQYYNIFPAL